ncbi:HAMP domain-containing protein, partial [Rhodovulum strictum]|nr:HAMP domain-containing protein [Rhodovulum strictum]
MTAWRPGCVRIWASGCGPIAAGRNPAHGPEPPGRALTACKGKARYDLRNCPTRLHPVQVTMFKALLEFPIRYRLPFSNALVILLVTGLMGLVAYQQAAHEQKHDAEQRIEFVARDQAARIEAWIEQIRAQLIADAANPFSSESILDFRQALAGPPDAMARARAAYVTENPNPSAQDLDDARDGTSYSAAHRRIHPVMRETLQTFGYYDIFLFDPAGNLVYTVVKESDFGENFATGPNAETGLGRVFAAALKAPPRSVIASDFEPYAPSAGAPAAFMAAPVFANGDDRVGVLAIQLPLDRLSALATAAAGIGTLGDMFIVGSDGRARTNSRFAGRFQVFDALPDVPHIRALRSGSTGYFHGVAGVSGAESLVLSLPLALDWADWTLVAELDKAEYMAGLARFRDRMILIAAIAVVLATAVSLAGARTITRPLASFVESMKRVAGGDYSTAVAVAGRRDEIGTLGRTLVEYRDKLAAAEEAETRRERDRAAQEIVTRKLDEAMKGLAEGDLTCTLEERFPYGFEPIRANYNKTLTTLREMLMAVVESADHIHARAEEIGTASDDLSQRTENQAATLEETAAALDELTASVRAAADGAAEVERVVSAARGDAEVSGRVVSDAIGAMSEIKRSSDEIGQIIGVIDDIAFQTNLLALNAGVEA